MNAGIILFPSVRLELFAPAHLLPVSFFKVDEFLYNVMAEARLETAATVDAGGPRAVDQGGAGALLVELYGDPGGD